VLFGRSQGFSQLRVSGPGTLFLIHCFADLVRGHVLRTCTLPWGLIYGGVPPHIYVGDEKTSGPFCGNC
jgi:hypothetical protein